VILALADIDALKRSQDSGKNLESRLHVLVHNPPDLILTTTPEGYVLLVNSYVLEAARRPLTRSLFDYLESADREPMRVALHQALETGKPVDVTIQSFLLQDRAGPCVISVEPFPSADGIEALSVRVKNPAPPGGPKR
jgi:hypothetical protein